MRKSLEFHIGLIIAIIFSGILLACGRLPEFDSQFTATSAEPVAVVSPVTETPEIRASPTDKPQPTMTLSIEPSNEGVSTEIPTTRLIQECVAFEPSIDPNLSGSILLAGELSDSFDLFLLDIASQKLQKVLDQAGYSFTDVAVSPDDRQAAFIDVGNSALEIIDSTGQVQKLIPVDQNWLKVISWVDNSHLLIEYMERYPDTTLKPPANSVVFNLETETVEAEFPHGYPGQFYIGNGSPNWGVYYFSQSVFNPQFTRVVYPGQSDEWDALFLWDIEANAEIARFWAGDPNYGGLPVWSASGAYFIAGIYPAYERWDGKVFRNIESDLPYVGGYDLFAVDQDGVIIERLTYLTIESTSLIEEYTLSPDETRLAFWIVFEKWFEAYNNSRRQLAILDRETNEIKTLCIYDDAYVVEPVWHPDGEHLLVTVSDREKAKIEVVLIDLIHWQATTVIEQFTAQEWLLPTSP